MQENERSTIHMDGIVDTNSPILNFDMYFEFKKQLANKNNVEPEKIVIQSLSFLHTEPASNAESEA
tara:strand:- start:4385 stop:4582 length:198 start_codon:yes stop_codon:yes gene_type:complete